MENKIRILYVDDDRDFIYLIGKMLHEAGLELCGYAMTKEEGVRLAREYNPGIVLMDLSLSANRMEGIEAAKEIRLVSDAKVILLTSHEQPEISIEACKKSFASGYVFKSQCQLLAETIRTTAAGSTPQEQFIRALTISELSAAEQAVLRGLIGKDIRAASSEKTIANQKTSIFRKLGVKNTGELIRLFR